MLLEKLLDIYNTQKDTTDNIEFYGSTDSSKVMAIYSDYTKNKSVCVLSQSVKDAEKLQSYLLTLTDEVYIYPEIDLLRRFANKSVDLSQISLEILEKLVSKKNIILIIPINSLYRILKKPDDFIKHKIVMNLTKYEKFDELPSKLINMGYKNVSSVENIGEFSKRGSIIDIYSSLNNNPIRLDYFDDELDSIRIFDTETQKTVDTASEITIYPVNDFFLSEKDKEEIISKLEIELQNNDSIPTEVSKQLKNQMQVYREYNIFDELDYYATYISEDVYSIVDYLPENMTIYFDNFTKIENRVTEFNENYILKKKEFDRTYIGQKLVDGESFNKLINSKNTKRNLTTLKSSENLFEEKINIHIRDLEFLSSGKEIAKELTEAINKKYQIVILLNNKKQREYIEKILFDYELYDEMFVGLQAGKIHIEEAKFNLKGFISEKDKFLFITPNELFKNSQTKKKKLNFRNTNSEKIRSYQELNVGDYIVHLHHGIGLYQGIENIEVNNVNKDFLKIVFDGGDIIYVDIENMKYIQKYRSSNDEVKPKLNKLGSKKWYQTRSKVKKEIEDISEELIKIYIQRELNSGFAFSMDTPMQQEFEQDFLYTSTDDQERVTQEIKEDMEKSRPMDRLLCGDVGFGKTEVAMRVAFKAVMDNKQVAVLVPTTLLAEQHYENFLERFSNFPVNIEVVNRFKTTKDINEIIKKLENGQIDIVIGTHKLLNDKFKYKDLGLLIIDEEQRFGVKHKEKIKQLKNLIDVLTLSATPIPRTLHMSLIGIRDLSVIETPPVNRQPIQTFITRENKDVIRNAIINEVDREGQVFYLYNKVESIEDKYLELKRLLPEINIAYAHGRMSKKELEGIMTDVINREYDMLITTTIIETGIDISNVNTLIVEDADKFGLSQLYQIRGRVGRSSREAYAYFMYKPGKILTENSEKRLDAIKSFTALGSGFKIAMQDLSIRGAGDTLGAKQHGFIDSVGYTLYSQMLEKEIMAKKEILTPLLEEDRSKPFEYYDEIVNKKSKELNLDIFEVEENIVDIKLNVDAYIPREYIKSDADKLYFYKAINLSKEEKDIQEIVDELLDRFSDFGQEVENLIDLSYIRIVSENILVESIKELANKIIIKFDKKVLGLLDGTILFKQLTNYKDIRIEVKDTLILEITKSQENYLKKIMKIFRDIVPSIRRNYER